MTLLVVVRRDGRVGDQRVLRCSNPGFGFEAAAIEAVGRWRYEPATEDGEPVDVHFTVVVDFDLN